MLLDDQGTYTATSQQQLETGVLKVLPLSHGIRRATPLHLIVKRTLAPLDEQVETLLYLFSQPS
jgi:hypothetical protein